MTGNPSTMKLTFTSKEEPTNPSVTYWPKNNYEEHKSYIGNSNDVIEFTYPQDDSIVECMLFLLYFYTSYSLPVHITIPSLQHSIS